MAASKTLAGRDKVKQKFFVGDVEVKPVKIGKQTWWMDEANTIRTRRWTRREFIKIGGKQ